MKRIWKMAAVLALCACVAAPWCPARAQGEDIRVLVNGEELYFDQPPLAVSNRTMVPLRAIFEALGADVEWDQATQRITSRKGRVTLELRLGDSTMTRTDLLEGTTAIALDAAPFAVNNRTLVPVRAVSEGLGAAVDWDGTTHTVTITAPEHALEEYPLGCARLVLPGYGSPRLERDEAAGTEYLYWVSDLLCLEATAYPFPQKLSLWDLDRETLDGYVDTLAAGGEDFYAAGYADTLFLGSIPYVRLVYRDADTGNAWVILHTVVDGTAFTIGGFSPDGAPLSEEQAACLEGIAASLHWDEKGADGT